MNSPAHDVALYLQTQGIGTFGGGTAFSIHVGTEPAAPNDVVTLYDTGGPGPDTVEMDLMQPTFQVRTRSASYPAGYDKQEQIRDLLLASGSKTMATSRFVLIVMTSEIAGIGRDDNDRHIMVANYRAIRE